MPNLVRTRINCRSFSPQISSRSIRTWPESGISRPIRCFRSTLLPPPLRPIMATDSPVSTRKLTPSSTRCESKALLRFLTSIIQVEELVEHEGQEKVGDENGDAGINHGFSRSAPDALC